MDMLLIVTVFVVVGCFVLLGGLLLTGQEASLLDRRVEALVQDMRSRSGHCSAPRAGMATRAASQLAAPLMPQKAEDIGRLTAKVIQAGLYDKNAVPVFVGVKTLLVAIPLIVSIGGGSLGLVPMNSAILFGAIGGIVGLVGPNLWLNRCKAARQVVIRRALPDALDMMVVCLDGGLSPDAALQRVTKEIRTAHPLFGSEFHLVMRTTDMGLSLGESLRQFASRFDMEELRRLASMVLEADRFGTSIGKPLRVHAETLRARRQQSAEESARKAAIKVLFPTLILILPCVFVVILGPAAFRIFVLFETLTR